MKAILAACLISALLVPGCSAVTNYRKYELFMTD
jgi:hypothetical protein